MQISFDKCEHCGTMPRITMTYWGGVPIYSCPYVPECLMVPIRDPDQDNPIFMHRLQAAPKS